MRLRFLFCVTRWMVLLFARWETMGQAHIGAGGLSGLRNWMYCRVSGWRRGLGWRYHCVAYGILKHRQFKKD